MRGVTQESYEVARRQLGEFAAGAGPEAVAEVAEEVLGVAGMLRGQPRLRRALIDAGRSVDDRVGLLRSLLAGQVGAQTLDLLAALVSGHWSSPSELLTAVELLGVDGLLVAAGLRGDLAEVEDELFRFGQIVAGDSRLAAALGDPAGGDRRRQLVDELLEGKAHAATVRLGLLALSEPGGRGFTAAVTWIVERAARQREQMIAYVTVASELTAEDERRLAGLLSEGYGQGISVKVIIDPSVIGGVRVRVGSDLYDGTIARRLADARSAIAG